MAAIQKVADLAKYVKPLQSVILTRLLQQLSQVYTTVTLDSVVKLASFGTPEMIKYDADTIEKFVMNGCRRGELSIRISHQTRTLTFDAHVFGGSGSSSSSISQGPRLQALPSEQMRLQLSRLAKRLQSACVMIQYPIVSESLKQQRIQSAEMARVNALTENEATVNRRLLIEKKKELKEYESSRIVRRGRRSRKFLMYKLLLSKKKYSALLGTRGTCDPIET